MPRRRRPITTGRAQPSPLSAEQVRAILARHGRARPLTAAEIAEFCHAAHPDMPGVTANRVRTLLEWLEKRDRVRSLTSIRHRAELADLGITEPGPRTRYWQPIIPTLENDTET